MDATPGRSEFTTRVFPLSPKKETSVAKTGKKSLTHFRLNAAKDAPRMVDRDKVTHHRERVKLATDKEP